MRAAVHAIAPVLTSAWACKCQRCGYRWVFRCDCSVVTDLDGPVAPSSAAHKAGCVPADRCANQECKSRSWSSATVRAAGRPSADALVERDAEVVKQHKAQATALGRPWSCDCGACRDDRSAQSLKAAAAKKRAR